MSDKKRVMVVDDSPVFRALLSEIINSDPLLEVVATAEDPYQARELIKKHNPDVLTLDIEMPRMNGVQFLKNLMRLRPMPVVMISTLTQHGAEITLQALELGAVDYFPKPALNNPAEMVAYRDLVNDKVRLAAGANVRWDHRREQHVIEPRVDSPHSCRVIAIGASTGGTEAVRNVLAALPAGLPPVVITQHISALFSGPFAERLDSFSKLNVMEVTEGPQLLEESCAYVAPGDRHLSVFTRDGRLYAAPDDGPVMNRHKPSVNVMFDSVAEAAGGHAIAALLTGMGDDGASGMLRLKKQGAVTLAQDENTSVVWGMPRVAVELGAASTVAPLGRIPALICEALKQDSVVS